MTIQIYAEKLATLTIYKSLLSHPVIKALRNYLTACRNLPSKPVEDAAEAYCTFTAALYAETSFRSETLTADFSACLLQLVLEDENIYLKSRARQIPIPSVMEEQLARELSFLQSLSLLSSEDATAPLRDAGFSHPLPGFTLSQVNMSEEYSKRMDLLTTEGYGIFSKHKFFLFSEGEITPVKNPDLQSISQLSGYERERNLVIANTKAFLDGYPASNALLYGDAGTGKSSTVKAVANFFSDKGLRLIEVKKHQLYQIPNLLESLVNNPLHFLLFIDDLSFSSNDENFAALKAILEGSVSVKGKNTLIYATSNRRHLVKETMVERSGDELYLNDTLQETMSLSARFGLFITFQKPGKDAYLSIVSDLAAQYDLALPQEELFQKAEAFAIRSNGRSPRTAKQFIELQKAGL